MTGTSFLQAGKTINKKGFNYLTTTKTKTPILEIITATHPTQLRITNSTPGTLNTARALMRETYYNIVSSDPNLLRENPWLVEKLTPHLNNGLTGVLDRHGHIVPYQEMTIDQKTNFQSAFSNPMWEGSAKNIETALIHAINTRKS